MKPFLIVLAFVAILAAPVDYALADSHEVAAAGNASVEPGDGDDEKEAPAATGDGAREVVIGAGAVSGAYFPAAGALCRALAAADPRIRCLVESNDNSSENIKKLSDGLLDMAIVQSDWLMHAARGTNLFHATGPDESLRAVMALHSESLTLMVRAGAAIAKPADLKGKRISIGPDFTYQRLLFEAMLRAWGLDRSDLALVMEITAAEQFAALCEGQIDAAAIVVAHPSPMLAEAIQRCGLKLVPVAGRQVDDLLEGRPELAVATIPGGIYAGAPDDIPTFGLRAVLATTANVEDQVIRQITEAVLGDLSEFSRQHPVLAGVEAAAMPRAGIAIPLHPGAQVAYRARGQLSAD